MQVFQRRQIVILSLILMVVVAGYLQYTYNEGDASIVGKGRLGEAVYVDNDTEVRNINFEEEVNAEKTASNAKEYFARAKLDKEITRSKNTEILNEILESESVDEEMKRTTNEKILTMVSNSEKEMKIETLIKKNGYNDVIALFGEDGSLDLVVKAPELTSAQVAQIADIASRQGDVPMTKIHIKNIY